MKSYVFIIVAVAMIFVVAGCTTSTMDQDKMDPGNTGEDQGEDQSSGVSEEDGGKVIQLEAAEIHWMFSNELMTDAWVYNGTLPGQEIRVKEGDHVQVRLLNSLDEPTAIHFHGVPLPNEMDGVPGITQNAVMPGEEFTYEFVANTPGTYWYHSHQDGANQVEKGLYGVFIVEPNDQPEYDVDQVIVLDEYASMEMDDHDMGGGMNHGNINPGGMNMDDVDHGDMNIEDLSHREMMNMMYDNLIVNGKADSAIETIEVAEGDRAKLRFVNAGLFTQVINIPGHKFQVTHYDGQPVNEPEWIADQAIRIAPAERYDVEIKVDQPGAWGIQVFAEENSNQLNAHIPLVYTGHENEDLTVAQDVQSFFDLTTYGTPQKTNFGEITKEFDMILDTNDGGETFTINDHQMSTEDIAGHEVYEVDEGDVVKVTIFNDTDVDHPMHLHGHFFYVVSRNGEAVSGSPILKETLNVRPDETYEVVFVADNPGQWMFHCHELHHASDGMVAKVKYDDFKPAFSIDPNVPNKPE